MNTQAQTAACVFCDEAQPILPGGIIVAHRYPDGSDCPGSSRRAAQRDGNDEVRRHAIMQLNAVNGSIATRRAELGGDMAKGWKVADLFEYHGAVLMRLETVAARWYELAAHGDWWIVFDSALRGCVLDSTSTAPIDQAAAYERARGNRLWLAEARTALAKESAKLDTAGQNIVDNLLYRM